MDCYSSIICEQYLRFSRRLQQLQPKRHRRKILFLSKPKYVARKRKPCNKIVESSRKTEIIRDKPRSTRIEQLSYPNPRKIMPTHENFKHVLSEERRKLLRETMKKSFFSLYSRLANFQPPRKKPRIKKWSPRQWEIHKKYLYELSRPKPVLKPPSPVKKYKDLSIMRRFLKLCKPKRRIEHHVPPWQLTKALKNYEPTPKIIKLATPKEYGELAIQTLPLKVSPGALKYKASERIIQLATNAEIRLGESDLKDNPFGVAPNALKGKASDRIIELAQPKEYEEGQIKKNAFAISPAALKAKASPRTIELAQPKNK